MTKNSSIAGRAKISVRGLRAAWQRERSFRTHVWLCLAAVAAMASVRSRAWEWAVVLVALCAALALETMNAAIEALVDKLHPGRDPEIGTVKDLASGAAFVANCAACGVTLAIIARHLG